MPVRTLNRGERRRYRFSHVHTCIAIFQTVLIDHEKFFFILVFLLND